MIKGAPLKERSIIIKPNLDYRKLAALNCSMIKLFDTDPVKFFEQFKLGKTRPDNKSISLQIGDMVDFFILECKGDEDEFDRRFEEKFALFEDNKGTGQVYTLADELFKITKLYTNEDNEVTVSFENRFAEAIAKTKALGKYSGKTDEKILEDFNKNGYNYFKFLTENYNKTVVDVSLLDKAKKVARNIIEDNFTQDLFIENDNEEYLSKFIIEWKYKNTVCKSEIDLLKVCHSSKKIYIYDLKTTFDNESFEYGYLKYRYDLQAAFYYLAVEFWRKEEQLEDYDIVPMEFIVGDTSSNNRRPIRFKTSEVDLQKSLNGFSIKGNLYKGIHQLMEEIMWAEHNNMWNVSKVVFDSKGILDLKLNYD